MYISDLVAGASVQYQELVAESSRCDRAKRINHVVTFDVRRPSSRWNSCLDQLLTLSVIFFWPPFFLVPTFLFVTLFYSNLGLEKAINDIPQIAILDVVNKGWLSSCWVSCSTSWAIATICTCEPRLFKFSSHTLSLR